MFIDYEKGKAIYEAEMDTARVLNYGKGHKDGEERKANQIALKLLKRGLPLADISEDTGLTIEELQQLSKEKA